MQIEFEKKLTKMGLSIGVHHDGFYTISNQAGGGNLIIVRLISSLPVSKQVHGSKNGNEVQGIGLFKFPVSGLVPDIVVFAFRNSVKDQVEFILIPTEELMSRLVWKCPSSIRRKRVGMVVWLMDDGCVYDTTNISVEAEWYFLSKGVNGRMATGSELDYSEYLNSWRRLIV